MMPPDLYSPDIGPDGIAVYGVLCLHVDGKTGECWPSQETIAERIGIGRKRVSAAVDVLIARGFVHLVRDHGFKGARKYLLPHQIHCAVADQSPPLIVPKRNNQQGLIVPKRTIEMFQNGPSESAKMEHEPYVIEPNDIEPEKGDTPQPPKRTKPAKPGRFLDGFREFYDAYPRHKDPDAAERAWSNLRPDADLRAVIMADIEARRQTWDWQKEDWRYVPYPATYLNGKRWRDELGGALPPSPSPNGAYPANGTGRQQQAKTSLDRVLQVARGES